MAMDYKHIAVVRLHQRTNPQRYTGPLDLTLLQHIC